MSKKLFLIITTVCIMLSWSMCVTFAESLKTPEAAKNKDPKGVMTSDGKVLSYTIVRPSDTSVDEEIMPGDNITDEVRQKNIKMPDGDELLTAYITKHASDEARLFTPENSRKTRGSRLTGNDAVVYNAVRDAAEKIAAGEQDSSVVRIRIKDMLGEKLTYSAEELNEPYIVGHNGISEEAVNEFSRLFSFDENKVMQALLYDCPYEFYWFDKVNGFSADEIRFGAVYDGNEWVMTFDDNDPAWVLRFFVSRDYSKTDSVFTTDVDTLKTGLASAAAETAGLIVENNKSKSDLAKLTAYRDKICELTSYNYDVLNAPPDYGDPWQLIYVFDGEASTKVVCEGYAKAFQFLCDLSSFRSGLIKSHIVNGIMSGGIGAGSHMWNVMHMDDGQNYLVDITNCDTGSIGEPDLLFLTGYYSGSYSTGYTYRCNGEDITYTYSDDSLQQYNENELALSGKTYVETEHNECDHTLSFIRGSEATCTQDGSIDRWFCTKCRRYFSDEECTEEIEDEDWIVSASGHDIKHVTAREATCDEDGTIEYWYCRRCKKTYSDENCSNEIDKADCRKHAEGHDLLRLSSGENRQWYCTGCDRIFTDDESHIIPRRACNITYSFENGTLTFSGTGNMYDMDEGEYGYEKSWVLYKDLTTKIVIGEGITSICDFAFQDFDALREIQIPSTVRGIGDQAFDGCDCLREVTLPDDLILYGSEMLARCPSLKTVTFGRDTAYHTLIYNKGNYFIGDSSLDTINIPEDNLAFTEIDNVLYDKPCTTLLSYPMTRTDKVFTLADSTVEIPVHAFFGNRYLEHINLPDSLRVIWAHAFNQLTALSDLTIPSGVRIIGKSDFEGSIDVAVEGCTSLTTITNLSDSTMLMNINEATWTGDDLYRYFWIDSESGELIDHLEQGTAIRTQSIVPRSDTVFALDDVSYRVTKLLTDDIDGNPIIDLLTLQEINAGVPVADVEVIKNPLLKEIPDTIRYGIWTLNVTRKDPPPDPILPHKHTLIRTEARRATCSRPGNIEYWYCDDCGRYFSDGDGNEEITETDTVIPKNNIYIKSKATITVKSKKKTVIKSSRVFKFSHAKGKVSFKKIKGNSKVSISSSGNVTVKKGLKAGKIYKVKVKIKSKATAKYAEVSKNVTLVIRVK